MFDIGFFELLLVAIVGLLVIGPERLPETIRSVSLWIGRLKRSISATKAELEQQLGTEDIRRQLHNETIMRELKASREEIERVLKDNYVEPVELPDHAHMDEPDTHPSATPDNQQDQPASEANGKANENKAPTTDVQKNND
ncbi:Sec-independent protein translocase protein TatB [Simiduia curdlanivorans]|uniref:Sec-independent protein translocase protein TatB n=1 Tax=Simiduia curdlanivorans TaxID=1492769 RepID=A0ABV8V2M4_9GAMM|nr:Sec-independent protein translocase protein TatB [Simiduia curdlanivorans]MDN3637316.1 Sec-independent protein translocase protein TatB [Simiduia curdlanivorans]